MSVRKILTEPNKLLRQVSMPVEKVGDQERKLMDDMLDTMYAANGIGLAAVQIGVPKRIIVMDISRDENGLTGCLNIYDALNVKRDSQTLFVKRGTHRNFR